MPMRCETIISEYNRKRIEEYQKKIEEIINWHLDGINVDTASGIMEMERAIKRIKTDSSIKLLEKAIENIYIHTVPQMLLIAETDEDKKQLHIMVERADIINDKV